MRTNVRAVSYECMLTIKQAESAAEIDEARTLFREYEAWFGLDLCFQGFENELNQLPGKYALPHGRLLLAFQDEHLAGCVALRMLDKDICEMKRLFVRDAFRGRAIGGQLIERLITEARIAGYSRIRLDTFPPKMEKAVRMYVKYGFSPIPPYYKNPYEGVLFMELKI